MAAPMWKPPWCPTTCERWCWNTIK